MENIDLIILICLVILLVQVYLKNKTKKYKQKKIDTKNIYKIDDHNDVIYKNDIDFYKTHYVKNNTEKEIIQINIEKGKITRQSIIDESGGSRPFNKLKINSNISGNEIIQQAKYRTYAKLPTKINI